MKYIALILGLTLPVSLLSCTKAEAQLGANLKYEKIMMDPNCGLTPTATKSTIRTANVTRNGMINTVKAWCQEKEINYDDGYLVSSDFPTIFSQEKNLEISEDNTITFKLWPPDIGGDAIQEELLPKTDWENYFDKNGNFTADGLSWIHKDWIHEKFENDKYLCPQKNKH